MLYIGTMTVSSVTMALTAGRIRAVPAIRDSQERSEPVVSWAVAAMFALALAVSLAIPATGYYPLLLLLLLLLTGTVVRGWRRLRPARPVGDRVGD